MNNSLSAEKFVVRLPDGLRTRINDAALSQHRSMNAVILVAIEQHLDAEQRQQVLIDALAAQAKAQA